MTTTTLRAPTVVQALRDLVQYVEWQMPQRRGEVHHKTYAPAVMNAHAALNAYDAARPSREEWQRLIAEGKGFADTDPEAAFVEQGKHACPACGGSGHRDDIPPKIRALIAQEPQS